MRPHNLLLIMAVVFAVVQLGTDRFPTLLILFNVIGVGSLIPWGPIWSRLIPPTPTPPSDNQISV
jgi:hypothetical protein